MFTKIDKLLLVIALSFFLFTLSILTDTYDYFLKDKFYEGFMVVASVGIFDFVGLLFFSLLMSRKDFKNIKIISLFYVLLTFCSFLAFRISLVVLPIISTIATIRIGKLAFRKVALKDAEL